MAITASPSLEDRADGSGQGDRSAAYFLLRVALGMSMFLHGLGRVLSGVDAFASGMVAQFAGTPLPRWSVRVFGLGLPFVELGIGLLLLLGLWTRWALIAGGVTMICLILGTTLRKDYQTVGLQLLYSLIYSLLLYVRGDDRLSIDWWRVKRKVRS